MKDRIRLGVAAVASPLEEGSGEGSALRGRLQAAFGEADSGWLELFSFQQPVTDPDAAVAAGRYFYDQRVDAICVISASWFEDYLVLDMLEECDVPLIGWARPGMETGSLCGMQQLGFMLKELGRAYRLVFDQPESQTSLRKARDYALAAAVRRQLRRARLGFIGHRTEGMTETTGHELAMKKIFGPRIVGIDTALFFERAARVAPDSLTARWQALKGQVGQVNVPQGAGIESLQVYTAMKEVVENQGLAALAMGCYPHWGGKVCLAVSLLGEEGIPVGCEGDVNGTLVMLILSRLTRSPAYGTDLLDPIPDHNSILFSHCGAAPFSFARSQSEIALEPVRLMDQGLCCLFTTRPGPCTLVHLAPTMGGYRLASMYGEALETTMVFRGNPLEVRFRSDYRDILAWIADNGLGHHWMAAYGDLRPVLADLTTLVGCPLLSIE